MDSSMPSTLVLGVAAFGLVGLGYVANLVVRRPILNPWLIGIGALALVGLGHAWLVIRSGLLNTEDAFLQGERFGENVIGPVALPLLFLVWQAKRFSRRGGGPGATKGSFVGALMITGLFVVAMGLGIAIMGPLIRATGAGGEGGRAGVGGSSDRPAALEKLAAEVSATLPKTVDAETELFHIAAEGDALVYDYRMLKLAKSAVDPKAVADFRSGIIKHACSTQKTRDQFLRQGVVLRHRYYDQNKEFITSVEVAWKDCEER
jgi:hypothetical protein